MDLAQLILTATENKLKAVEPFSASHMFNATEPVGSLTECLSELIAEASSVLPDQVSEIQACCKDPLISTLVPVQHDDVTIGYVFGEI